METNSYKHRIKTKDWKQVDIFGVENYFMSIYIDGKLREIKFLMQLSIFDEIDEMVSPTCLTT